MSIARRDFSIDALRCIAIVLIVLVHTTAAAFYTPGPHWRAVVPFGSVARAGVPLFFMISGAMLLNRAPGPRTILQKCGRVVIALAAWSVVYLFIDKANGIDHPNWVRLVLTQPVAPHLWFLYTLLGAYLAWPALSAIHMHIAPAGRAFVLASWFMLVSVYPAIANWTGPFLGIDPTFISIYFGYFLLGASMYDLKPSRAGALAGAVLLAGGTVATLRGTIEHSAIIGKPSELLYNYWSPNVVATAAGIFLVVRYLARFEPGPAVRRAAEFLASVSFGVYLAHFALIILMNQYVLPSILLHPSWLPLVMALAIVAVCAAAVGALMHVPLARMLVSVR